MKKNRISSRVEKIIFFTVTLLFAISCNKEDKSDATSSKQIISFVCENSDAMTKTSLNGVSVSWKAGTDRVGIYSPQALPTVGGSANVVNRSYEASTSSSSSSFVAVPGNEMYWGSGSHDFYAYYPYTSGTVARDVVPISLPNAQTQSSADNVDHLAALDFMVARKTGVAQGVTGQATAVSLSYNHVFSIIEFDIIGSGSLSKVWLSSVDGIIAFNSATIDITQSTPAQGAPYATVISSLGTSNEITLTLTSPASLSATSSKVYMMVNPCTPTAELNIGLYIDGSWKYLQKSASPTGGIQRGKKYVVAVNTANATDYPGTTHSPVTVGANVWAPVNAGYSPSRQYGLMYQWHRKIGQEYKNYPCAVVAPVNLELGSASAYAQYFFSKDADSYFEWSTASMPSWDMARAYNPCPMGWKVPNVTQLESLASAGSTWVDNSGIDNLSGRWISGNHSGDHTNSLFIPASGFLNSRTGAAADQGASGAVWSTSVTTVYASTLSIQKTNYMTSVGIRAQGCSVRCVKE